MREERPRLVGVLGLGRPGQGARLGKALVQRRRDLAADDAVGAGPLDRRPRRRPTSARTPALCATSTIGFQSPPTMMTPSAPALAAASASSSLRTRTSASLSRQGAPISTERRSTAPAVRSSKVCPPGNSPRSSQRICVRTRSQASCAQPPVDPQLGAARAIVDHERPRGLRRHRRHVAQPPVRRGAPRTQSQQAAGNGQQATGNVQKAGDDPHTSETPPAL